MGNNLWTTNKQASISEWCRILDIVFGEIVPEAFNDAMEVHEMGEQIISMDLIVRGD